MGRLRDTLTNQGRRPWHWVCYHCGQSFICFFRGPVENHLVEGYRRLHENGPISLDQCPSGSGTRFGRLTRMKS